MGIYPQFEYKVGEGNGILHACRAADKVVAVRPNLPGNMILVHGVNDVGTSYDAVERGLCAGLGKRLHRDLLPAAYTVPTEQDKDILHDDPDAVFFKRKVAAQTDSPVIPFYWGYREVKDRSRVHNGQHVDRYGNRLDKDLSKGGGPFVNATNTIPDMWNRGAFVAADVVHDPIRPLRHAPGRMYMVLAAQRLAALVAMIRDYADGEAISVVAHSQGCLLTLLAQAMLMERGVRPADTLILTHPPYGLDEGVGFILGATAAMREGEDAAMRQHYHAINGRQTLHARLQTLVNIVHGVTQPKQGPATPAFDDLNEHAKHRCMTASSWRAEADRDNRGKVYLYFCPEDMTVALDNVRGIGWQGVPDRIGGTQWQAADEYDRGAQTRPLPVTRHPLKELGPRFYQRVFTARRRKDASEGEAAPVLVGKPPHDFPLSVEGEDDHAHVAASGRSFRRHLPKETRRINGEALPEAVAAEMGGRGRVPKHSVLAHVPLADQGPCEDLDPNDAAVAVSTDLGLKHWMEEIRDPEGMQAFVEGPQNLWHRRDELTALYNKEKGLSDRGPNEQRKLRSIVRHADGRIMADVEESYDEARLRWQHEVSPVSFHSSIIGNARNHEKVTAYDVAIGGGKASTDPRFYAYLCAVADWRLVEPPPQKEARPGILTWKGFLSEYAPYWASEPAWRSEVIEGNKTYYSDGVLPTCLPILKGPLWDIVISEIATAQQVSA
ncbi:MAG TPA: DUF3274 domain-containing protein [Burkholderiaceae bacterium]